jgi:aromatic-L-amino-acid decarboxylase
VPDLTPDEFRERAAAAVEWVAAYRAGLPDRPVQPDVVPGSVRAAFPTALPEAPQPLDALLAALDRTVVPASSHWQHPGCSG